MAKKTHVVILGCPAVGKLTTARALSRRLDYPVFDNAKIVDLVSLIHLYGTIEFRIYRDFLRYSFYSEALKNGNINGLISTNVLRHPDNWRYFGKIEGLFESADWETRYILLTASNDALFKRVSSESRKSKNTIATKEELTEWLNANPLYNSLENRVFPIINTTEIDAEEAADRILSFLEEGDEA